MFSLKQLAPACLALAFAHPSHPTWTGGGGVEPYFGTVTRGQIAIRHHWPAAGFAQGGYPAGALYDAHGAGQISKPLEPVRSFVHRMAPDSPNTVFEEARVRFEFDAHDRAVSLARHDIMGDLAHQVLLERDPLGRVVGTVTWSGDSYDRATSATLTYDALGRLCSAEGIAQRLPAPAPGESEFEALRIELEYQQERVVETLRRHDLVHAQRLHTFDSSGRVNASYSIRGGQLELIARYEYSESADGSTRAETWRAGTWLSELQTWDRAGDELLFERYDQSGRCTWRRELHKCGSEWTELSRYCEFAGPSAVAVKVLEEQSVRRLPDQRIVRSRHRGGSGSDREVERRYAYVDDHRGNWVRRETFGQADDGEWALREVHLRDIEYR